jgi:hypothetical protein
LGLLYLVENLAVPLIDRTRYIGHWFQTE